MDGARSVKHPDPSNVIIDANVNLTIFTTFPRDRRQYHHSLYVIESRWRVSQTLMGRDCVRRQHRRLRLITRYRQRPCPRRNGRIFAATMNKVRIPRHRHPREESHASVSASWNAALTGRQPSPRSFVVQWDRMTIARRYV